MKPNLVISSTAMTCAVGHDVLTACASIRCNIVRPALLPYSTVDEDLDDVFVVGYPLAGYTDGYEGAARYGVIIQEVMADLTRQGVGNNDAEYWNNTAIVIGISELREGGDYTPEMDLNLLKTVLNDCMPYIDIAKISFVLKGNASAQYAIQQAALDIQRGNSERVLIICVDSLVGSNEMNFYMNAGRIKMDDNVNGFIPGEAGVAIIVESEESAITHKGQYLASISSVNVKNSGLSNEQIERTEGTELANLIVEATEQTVPKHVYLDLNGENWRAREWGNAYVKLGMKFDDLNFKLHIPAESLGDTGACSGLISVCTAIHAFERGYAQTNEALILSSSDAGELGAMLIKHA